MTAGGIAKRVDAAVARIHAGAAVIAARPIATIAIATAVVSVVAVVFPGIDIAVTDVFPHGPNGFAAADIAALGALRRAGMAVTHWAVVGLAVAVLAKMATPMLARAIPMRSLVFLVTSLALGPGLLVNGLLKETWGRPRPDETTLFGGVWDFMPAWVPGGPCVSNCSFPSGEASGAMWLLALVFVVPPARRRAILVGVLVWTLVISLNRMAFGRHFLSDVLIGWGLVAVVVLACRVAILERMPDRVVAAIERGLERTGAAFLAVWPRPRA